MNRNTIERLLAKAQQTQQQVEAKVGAENARKDPVWRNANANRRQLVRRLNAVSAVEKLDTDLKSRKESAE